MPTNCQHWRNADEEIPQELQPPHEDLLPRVLVDRDRERGRSVADHRRNDQRMYSSPPEFGRDRVTHVVQAGGGMEPCKTCQLLECMRERVWV